VNYSSYITEQIARDRQSERRQEAVRDSRWSKIREALKVASAPVDASDGQVRSSIQQEMGPVAR